MSSLKDDKKILPMKYPEITSYPNHAHLLSILSSNDENLSWFYNFYFQLSFRKSSEYLLDFYIANNSIPILKYCPLITYNGLSREFIAMKWDSIIDFIIESINSGYYVHMVIDQYYIQPYESYMKRHTDHGILIFGYDKNKKLLHVADFFTGNQYKYMTATFTMIIDGYNSIKCNDWLTGVVLLKENRYNVRRVFDIGILKDLIYDYLNSCNSYERSILIKHQFHTDDFAFGLQIYEVIEEYLNNISSNALHADIRTFHVLWDHKKIVLSIIKYMFKFGYINNAEYFYNKFLLIKTQALILRNLMIKYNISENKAIISKASNLVRRIKIDEKQLLKELIDNINESQVSLPVPSGRSFENTSLYIDYIGEWITNEADYGTSYNTDIKDSFVQLSFYGTSLYYIATKNKYCGYADIYIDGDKMASVNLYSQENIYAYTAYFIENLSLGYHIIRIVCAGTKDIISFGTKITFDSFIIHSNTVASENLNEAIFIGVDDTTQGAWKSIYGSIGYDILGVKSLVPQYIELKYTNANTHVWANSSKEIQALQIPDSLDGRVALFRCNKDSFSIDLIVYGNNYINTAFYMCDYYNFNNAANRMFIEVLNPDTKEIIFKQNIKDYHNGIYLKFKIKGHIIIRFNSLSSSSGAKLSGIFFD